MDPIRDAMDIGNFDGAREMAIARVRASPEDDNAVQLLLEVERRAILDKRKRSEDDGDDTLSGMFPGRWRRKLDNRLTVVLATVFLAVSGWWFVMGVNAGPNGSFPVRSKTGRVMEVRRPEALRTAALMFAFGAGGVLFSVWRMRRE